MAAYESGPTKHGGILSHKRLNRGCAHGVTETIVKHNFVFDIIILFSQRMS